MLLAEEFVLLALDPEGKPARGITNQYATAVGVTAALVAELALDGHLDLRDGRIGVTGSRPDHPLLAQALDNIAPHEGKKLKSRLSRVKHAGWREVVDAMVDDGVLGREKLPLRPTRHPVTDPAAHAALLHEVRSAATGYGLLSPRLATLLALAGPGQLLEVVAPDKSDRKHAKARIAEAAQQVPTAHALRYVVESMQAAVAVTGAGAAVYSGG